MAQPWRKCPWHSLTYVYHPTKWKKNLDSVMSSGKGMRIRRCKVHGWCFSQQNPPVLWVLVSWSYHFLPMWLQSCLHYIRPPFPRCLLWPHHTCWSNSLWYILDCLSWVTEPPLCLSSSELFDPSRFPISSASGSKISTTYANIRNKNKSKSTLHMWNRSPVKCL